MTVRKGWTLIVAMTASALLSAAATRAVAAAHPWRELLRDHSAPDWRGWKSPGLPAGWRVEGGVLSKEGRADDLVTNDSFKDFELALEWKIGKGGNSGIFYRAARDYDHIYWSGPEYQILDDANAPDGKNRLTSAAAAYGLYGAPPEVVLAFGQWNETRILVQGTHVEHWLNGRKVVEYELNSPDWRSKVASSKFSAYPKYGTSAAGMIGIQGDHAGALAIRRLRIRELP